MQLIFVDVDNTLVDFQPTSRLYKALYFTPPQWSFVFQGYLMLIVLKFLWYVPGMVKFQRKWILSLMAKSSPEVLEEQTQGISQDVISRYNNSEFRLRLNRLYDPAEDKIFLLTHCPAEIASKLAHVLKFDGHFSLKIQNYFVKDVMLENFDKKDILRTLKTGFNPKKVIFIADDMIDFSCLKIADLGIMVNTSKFTRFFAKYVKNIEIWG